MGMIDIHSHILPGMDDGAKDREAAVSLLRALKAQGVTTVCATPHYYAGREGIGDFISRRDSALQKMSDCVEKEICTIVAGAEAAFFSRMSEKDHLDLLCLSGTRTLLLEMPFADWTESQVEELLSLVLDRNYHIILAHPERYLFSKTNQRYLEKLSGLPLSLQVNADTLIRLGTRRVGLKLLQMTDSPLLGSDCHNLKDRAPHLAKARSIVRSRLGEDFLIHMDHCAARAVFGQPAG